MMTVCVCVVCENDASRAREEGSLRKVSEGWIVCVWSMCVWLCTVLLYSWGWTRGWALPTQPDATPPQ
jgi:hypothetical protein